jgi:hypothetical protein
MTRATGPSPSASARSGAKAGSDRARYPDLDYAEALTAHGDWDEAARASAGKFLGILVGPRAVPGQRQQLAREQPRHESHDHVDSDAEHPGAPVDPAVAP